jgi:hypothetical protein
MFRSAAATHKSALTSLEWPDGRLADHRMNAAKVTRPSHSRGHNPRPGIPAGVETKCCFRDRFKRREMNLLRSGRSRCSRAFRAVMPPPDITMIRRPARRTSPDTCRSLDVSQDGIQRPVEFVHNGRQWLAANAIAPDCAVVPTTSWRTRLKSDEPTRARIVAANPLSSVTDRTARTISKGTGDSIS